MAEGIGGWKTKTGLITTAIGGALVAAAQFAPSESVKVWCSFIGTLLVTFGGAFAGYGVADKVVKGQTKAMIAMAMLIPMALLSSGCAITGAKSISDMTPKEKVTWMYGTYNSQYADYQSMTGNTWNDATKKWDKTSFPALSDDQKKALRNRKDMLTTVYPLIKAYDSMLGSGAVPDRQAEQKIIDLLNSLLSM